MIYLNSIKIMFNNFSLTYKTLLYKLLAILITASVAISISFGAFSILSGEGLFQILWEGISSFNLATIFSSLNGAVDLVIASCIANKQKVMLPLIIAGVVACVLGSLLFNLDKIALCEVMDGKMSSNCKLSYVGMIFSRFGSGLIYGLTSLVFVLPFDALFTVSLIFSLKLTTITGFVANVSPFIIMFIFSLYLTLRLALYSAWVPTAVMGGKGIFKSLFKSSKVVFRKFFRTFSYAFLVVISAILVNMLLLISTAGVGLIVGLPATIVWFNAFSLVNTYVTKGNRFYVDGQTIISPKKLELEEKIKNQINLI